MDPRWCVAPDSFYHRVVTLSEFTAITGSTSARTDSTEVQREIVAMDSLDLDFEVFDGDGLQATFRNGADAMLWAHQLINRGGTYIRVVHVGDDAEDPAELVSWRFDIGGEEMPVAIREA